jgi:hypothetical protein
MVGQSGYTSIAFACLTLVPFEPFGHRSGVPADSQIADRGTLLEKVCNRAGFCARFSPGKAMEQLDRPDLRRKAEVRAENGVRVGAQVRLNFSAARICKSLQETELEK